MTFNICPTINKMLVRMNMDLVVSFGNDIIKPPYECVNVLLVRW